MTLLNRNVHYLIKTCIVSQNLTLSKLILFNISFNNKLTLFHKTWHCLTKAQIILQKHTLFQKTLTLFNKKSMF